MPHQYFENINSNKKIKICSALMNFVPHQYLIYTFLRLWCYFSEFELFFMYPFFCFILFMLLLLFYSFLSLLLRIHSKLLSIIFFYHLLKIPFPHFFLCLFLYLTVSSQSWLKCFSACVVSPWVFIKFNVHIWNVLY